MRASRAIALLLIVLQLVATLSASADEPVPGRWDVLGEDGAVFVPDEPPLEAAYLPGPALGAYHNVSEAVAAIQALAASRPDLLSVRTAGASVQGRPLLLATLTAPGDSSGRARVLFDGAHHGDEVIAAEILVRFLQRGVAQYDTNATMRAYLASTVVDIVPMVNPDGIDLVPQCSHYAACRKNANGVDLNRNYPSHWGEPGASGNPSDATYRGPAPASEPETRVIRDLLDTGNYSLYASLHSGAEMILWPYGWTTSPPPEESVYNALGNELSAITGAPQGQVSRILYGVSGDSMDQAYVSAAHWRALAVSPETYEGSGDAFDWWLLFNPPETEAAIAPVFARWDRFLWHLVKEAPNYAPARLEAPATLSLGPDAGEANVLVTGAPRRPLQGASLAFSATGGSIDVLSANPVALASQSGPQARSFTLLPTRGGDFEGTFELRAGPAGFVRRPVALELVQVGLDLALASAQMGSPESNVATVMLDAGPFARVAGTVTLTAQPQGALLGSVEVEALAGTPAVIEIPFGALELRAGDHTIVARALFNATDGNGTVTPGQLTASAPLRVLRPQVDLEKRFAPTTIAGNALLITSIYRNVGTSTAEGLVVRESIPAGYAYWFRDGPVPVPLDPLGRPQPTAFEPQPDGTIDVVWELGDVAPGQLKAAQYRLMALAPGTHTLESAWSYQGTFPTATVDYEGSAGPAHTVRSP